MFKLIILILFVVWTLFLPKLSGRRNARWYGFGGGEMSKWDIVVYYMIWGGFGYLLLFR